MFQSESNQIWSFFGKGGWGGSVDDRLQKFFVILISCPWAGVRGLLRHLSLLISGVISHPNRHLSLLISGVISHPNRHLSLLISGVISHPNRHLSLLISGVISHPNRHLSLLISGVISHPNRHLSLLISRVISHSESNFHSLADQIWNELDQCIKPTGVGQKSSCKLTLRCPWIQTREVLRHLS